MPKDPLVRMRAYLRSLDLLDKVGEQALTDHADSIAAAIRKGLNTEVTVNPAELFEYVYAEKTSQLREQAEQLREELAREAEGAEEQSAGPDDGREAMTQTTEAPTDAAAPDAGGRLPARRTTATFAKALNAALADAMEADAAVLMFGEDVGRLGGVFRITDGLTGPFRRGTMLRHPRWPRPGSWAWPWGWP